MRLIRKIISTLLCLMLVFGTLAISGSIIVSANQSGTCGDSLTWEFNSATGLLTISGTGNMDNYSFASIIPWSIYALGRTVDTVRITNGVTSIGKNAFSQTGVKSIEIPDSVTSIGENAFRECSYIESITLPDSIINLDQMAFYKCKHLKSVVIGSGITEIKQYTFYDCDALENVSIGSNVTTIGVSAFGNCQNISGNLIIPDGVQTIENSAFKSCSQITGLNFGSGLSNIGSGAFSDCSNLESITVSEENSVYHSSGNCLIETASKKLILASKNGVIPDDGSVISISGYALNMVNVYIPASITQINNFVFSYPELESITVSEENPVYHSSGNCLIKTADKMIVAGCKNSIIPDDGSALIIGQYAFYNCYELTDIVIPNIIKSIYSNAFENCTGIESVFIPDSVEQISSNVFYKCSSLKNITIGKGSKKISSLSIYLCPKLESIVVSKENPHYHSSGNCLIETETKILIQGCNNSIIPNDGSITSIDKYAFDDCANITDMTLPDGLSKIEESAFYGCNGLKSVVIPKSVTDIKNYAFQNTRVADIYYYGTEEDWNSISIGTYNNVLATAKKHFYIEIPEEPASCTESGTSAYSYWSATDPVEYIVEPTEIPAGHSFTNYISDNNATCLQDGTKTAKCDNCEKTNTIIDEMSATGHNIVHHNGKASTCKEIGYAEYDTCSRCDYTTYCELPLANHKNVNEDGICDVCGEIINIEQHNKHLVGKAKLNAKSSTTVDYRSKVNITATASGVPDGYFLAIYSGNTLLEKGTKDKVSYTPKDNNKPAELKSDVTYTVKVIDGKNAVQKDSNGKDLTANVEIKVKQGFFDKLIAFFKGLFGLLPTVEIKP